MSIGDQVATALMQGAAASQNAVTNDTTQAAKSQNEMAGASAVEQALAERLMVDRDEIARQQAEEEKRRLQDRIDGPAWIAMMRACGRGA